MLFLMREISTIAARHNFIISVKHIAGIDNILADSLSCYDMVRFRQAAPHANLYSEPIPDFFPKLLAQYNRN
jgi:hypothetical protein